MQPIVENAVFHGILQKDISRGQLQIRADIEGRYLLLTAEDDGVGMSANMVRLLPTKESKDYGLKNVNDPIRLIYGR